MAWLQPLQNDFQNIILYEIIMLFNYRNCCSLCVCRQAACSWDPTSVCAFTLIREGLLTRAAFVLHQDQWVFLSAHQLPLGLLEPLVPEPWTDCSSTLGDPQEPRHMYVKPGLPRAALAGHERESSRAPNLEEGRACSWLPKSTPASRASPLRCLNRQHRS